MIIDINKNKNSIIRRVRLKKERKLEDLILVNLFYYKFNLNKFMNIYTHTEKKRIVELLFQ